MTAGTQICSVARREAKAYLRAKKVVRHEMPVQWFIKANEREHDEYTFWEFMSWKSGDR
jgi:hypothetical protein